MAMVVHGFSPDSRSWTASVLLLFVASLTLAQRYRARVSRDYFGMGWGVLGGGGKSRKGGNVVAVLQMVNKKGGQNFSEQARTRICFLMHRENSPLCTLCMSCISVSKNAFHWYSCLFTQIFCIHNTHTLSGQEGLLRDGYKVGGSSPTSLTF